MKDIRKQNIYWRFSLNAVNAFITKDNINELMNASGFGEDVGLLSIDIDGNDYWVFESLTVIKPRIIICEYNPIFGKDIAVTIPYEAHFNRTKAHYSNLYFGASLKAMVNLAANKGYRFIGTCSNAANAFFVREDLIEYLPKSLFESIPWYEYMYRQAKDRKGKNVFSNKSEELALIRDMEVYDLEKEKYIKIKELRTM